MSLPSPSKMPTSDRISESVLKPCFWPSQILYPTSRRSRFVLSPYPPWGSTRPLVYSYHHHHRLTIPLRFLPHHHNWSPRARWHSTLAGIRAANKFSYFTVTAAANRLNTQSSRWCNDQDPRPRVVTQVPLKEEGRRRRVILVKAILSLVLLNLLIENRRFLGQR